VYQLTLSKHVSGYAVGDEDGALVGPTVPLQLQGTRFWYISVKLTTVGDDVGSVVGMEVGYGVGGIVMFSELVKLHQHGPTVGDRVGIDVGLKVKFIVGAGVGTFVALYNAPGAIAEHKDIFNKPVKLNAQIQDRFEHARIPQWIRIYIRYASHT